MRSCVESFVPCYAGGVERRRLYALSKNGCNFSQVYARLRASLAIIEQRVPFCVLLIADEASRRSIDAESNHAL